MDNASYHSADVHTILIKIWKKEKTKQRLQQKIFLSTKPELLQNAFPYIESKICDLDPMANEKGYTVIRTTPYHC